MLSIEPELIDQIKLDEGLQLKAYQDTKGNWTIGYGHTPATEGEVWTEDHAETQLFLDLDEAADQLDKAIPWAESLGIVRWSVFVNMVFNEGIEHLLEFHETLAAAREKDWKATAAGMLNSEWATEVGKRATELANQMETNKWVLY
jgi:lysozyme